MLKCQQQNGSEIVFQVLVFMVLFLMSFEESVSVKKDVVAPNRITSMLYGHRHEKICFGVSDKVSFKPACRATATS